MADRTLTALYDSKDAANEAEQRLIEAGVPNLDIKITSQDAHGGDHKGLWDSIKSMFDPNDEDRHAYTEGLSRGGYLLTAKTDDDMTDRAIMVLENSHAIDFDQRQSEWKSQGWSDTAGTAGVAESGLPRVTEGKTGSEPLTTLTGTETRTSGLTATGSAMPTMAGADNRQTLTGDDTIKLAEERLTVGKREVERGGVKVRSYVVETPVSEQVSLRQERVEVERRPLNETVAATGQDLFRERTIELTETSEEAVVAKEAVVTEELVIRKDVEQRTETISDTVRRTEVDVDDTRKAAGETRSFTATDTDRLADETDEQRASRLESQTLQPRTDPSI